MTTQTEHKAEAPFTTAQRRCFYFTAAMAGAAVMIIEILGAKMLAPYVGTSHFVWTAQIAVTLVALAAGYYAGGLWVDRSPRYTSLYWAILVAAVYLCVAATQVERVAHFCLGFKLAVGSLLASACLFFVPLALLAMVGPFLVRMLTPVIENVGGNMGRLTAVSTLGSVVGTVLIGYVLVPLLPNSMTMILTAMALILVASACLVVSGARRGPKWAGAAALTLAVVFMWTNASMGVYRGPTAREIYRCNSNFGLLQVLETPGQPRRALYNDYLEQGACDTRTQQGLDMFLYLLHDLPGIYGANAADVLCIGLGIGIVPMQFAREGARVDVAEINPAVVTVAQRFFNLVPDLLNITLGDGRQFVEESHKRYDIVILDACLGDSQPSHLMTREAFTAMRRVLKPDGLVVVNCFGDFSPGRDFLVASLQKTLGTVFPSVRAYADNAPDAVVNVVFLASPAELRIRRAVTSEHVHPACRDRVEAAISRAVTADPSHGIVLTDDYNPVDYYDAANRERLRRSLALYMRSTPISPLGRGQSSPATELDTRGMLQ